MTEHGLDEQTRLAGVLECVEGELRVLGEVTPSQ